MTRTTVSTAQMWTETVPVCGVTGDPGCMDCLEGMCDGLRFKSTAVFTFCSCGANDVYGELVHEPGCDFSTASAPQGAGRE